MLGDSIGMAMFGESFSMATFGSFGMAIFGESSELWYGYVRCKLWYATFGESFGMLCLVRALVCYVW
jgi:hypothetical protein